MQLEQIPYALLDNVPVANFDTSTLNALRKLEFIKLRPAESIVSLDMKNLYKNFPINEAITLASRSLYSSEHDTEMSRSTFKKLLKLAVTNLLNAMTDAFVRCMA